MFNAMNRRSFLGLGAAVGTAALTPRWMNAQSTAAAEHKAPAHADTASTPIKTTQLYDNVYLLQGQGGNMALQIGPDGNVLIDASYAYAVPRIREVIALFSKVPADAPGILINTHWHADHTGGNEGMYEAGYTIFAHQKTRERLSTQQTMKMFHTTSMPATPGARPSITFDQSMTIWHNDDTLDLIHFAPAHTDTDIYIHFHTANVLHVGDIWFNGNYPFIDEGTGGSIDGMIRAGEQVLAMADGDTKIIPGHGPLGTKAQFQKYRDFLKTVRDKVAALKASGASEQDVIAKKPAAEFDAAMGKGFMNAEQFVGIVYRTL
jgi:glyoxylase-like metal-dependent hydrolase (beta-lactamase superfamily II)